MLIICNYMRYTTFKENIENTLTKQSFRVIGISNVCFTITGYYRYREQYGLHDGASGNTNAIGKSICVLLTEYVTGSRLTHCLLMTTV